MSDIPQSYLKAKDVARTFGVTRKTVFTWASEGLMPHFKIGRTLFFSRSDIDAYMQRNRFIGEIHCPALYSRQ